MAMTLQQIRDYVRNHLDLEVEDLPDPLLDAFIREGSKRIERAENRWPFYEVIYTMTTLAGQQDYTFSSISSELDSIHSIRGERWELIYVGPDVGDLWNPRNVDQQSEPTHWMTWATTLRLHPIPDTGYDLVIRAYRTPQDWVADGSGAQPDMPDELHNTVALWALQRAYAQQEDPELSAVFERMFGDELNEYRRRLNGMPKPQPIVLNSKGMDQGGFLPPRLQFDWGYSYRVR